MAQYLTSLGPSALSDFRRKNLVVQLGVDDVQAQYVHYVALQVAENGFVPSNIDQGILDQFLTYGDKYIETESTTESDKSILFVTPRQGTISPWSSKATSAAQVCPFGKQVRRIERGTIVTIVASQGYDVEKASSLLHDRMTETIGDHVPDLEAMFAQGTPAPAQIIDIHNPDKDSRQVLQEANESLGLALDKSDIDYLIHAYKNDESLMRSPVDIELFMFAQINSEHCRHKLFNASWNIDGEEKARTLFQMIRNTHEKNPDHVISAYSDNAAVLEGVPGSFFAPSPASKIYTHTKEIVHYIAKVETHNHPTAVSPFQGAATGSGGEIRDEGAVGRGSKPKAGLCGFSVSDLLIPNFQQPWERDEGKPEHIASALDIMLEAPIGSSAFNNEFGRPCITGYWRTLLTKVSNGNDEVEIRGFHKPIMIAGGLGSVRPQHALKDPDIVEPDSCVVIFGGPVMLVGLGGGAASSLTLAEASAQLDFASVQRGNAEVQRRAQEVIDACRAMGPDNPITLIHDIGAGGLSNGLPEIVRDAKLSATFELREIKSSDRSLSPLQIWCCEAQERYVSVIAQSKMNNFKSIADRERCEFSIAGQTNQDQRLILTDREAKDHPKPIDLPMSVLFGKPPKMSRTVESRKIPLLPFDSSLASYLPKASYESLLAEAVNRVLALPAVGSKSFLITIGDRTVGGLTARDQMCGPWQIPVADCGVTATSLTLGINTGEAMAMGEKPTLALISPEASARMSVAESLMNIAAASLLGGLRRVRLSANWMVAASHPGEGAALYAAVEAIGMELCPKLGLSIPVGKDSTNVAMSWTALATGKAKVVTAPLSVVITASALVADIRTIWTPTLRRLEEVGESVLLMVSLAEGRKAMGGSALAQVFGQVGNEAPDVRSLQLISDYFDAVEQLHEAGVVLAYHDISDGGLFTTVAEMAFAGRCGVQLMLDDLCHKMETADVIETLFNEELGAVFQVRKKDIINFTRCFATSGPPPGLIRTIGRIAPTSNQDIAIYHGPSLIYKASRSDVQKRWSATSYQMQRLRDNPECADAEQNQIADSANPGLSFNLTYDPAKSARPLKAWIPSSVLSKPRVAILREQGVNGQAEMAFAFDVAGFMTVDVHMTDILSGRFHLSSCKGLAAPGGFSYGDVLGAGHGWAKSVLLHPKIRAQFAEFFARPDTFTLGVCNGCQFLSHLKEIIPGAQNWPSLKRNTSEQYEARYTMVEVLDNSKVPSVLLHEMAGTKMPISTAHGEGRIHFDAPSQRVAAEELLKDQQVAMRYIDNYLRPTEQYPANPNGSPLGIAGFSSASGRHLAVMPHLERTILAGVGSWYPDGKIQEWGECGPWIRIFQSARRWVG